MLSIPEIKNTVYISHMIHVSKNIDDVFAFFINNNLSKYYARLSAGHKHFTLRDGSQLEPGSVIDCEESAGNQSIKHTYIVTEINPNERIYYVSSPSLLKIKLPWKTIDSRSNTYVFYDFESIGSDATDIRLTIGIQFAGSFEKFFSVLFGGINPWKTHCREETENLKSVISDISG